MAKDCENHVNNSLANVNSSLLDVRQRIFSEFRLIFLESIFVRTVPTDRGARFHRPSQRSHRRSKAFQAPSYPQANIPSSGPINSAPRCFNVVNILLSRIVRPHLSIHRGSDEKRRACGESDRSERIIRETHRELSNHVCCRGRDEKKIGAIREIDVRGPPRLAFIEARRR